MYKRQGQVERAIKNAARAEAFAGQHLTGARGGGDNNGILRKRGVKRLDQAADGQHLADRNCVDPDDAVSYTHLCGL